VALDISEASYQFLVEEQKAYSADLSVPEASIANLLKIDREVNPAGASKETAKLDLKKYYDPSFLAGK
jgi:hypothetical protein